MWHWVILLLLIGVPVFFAVRSAGNPSNPAHLVGFGGWLMLLAISQVLSPLRVLVDLNNSVDGYRHGMILPNGPLAVYGEIAINLAFMALQLAVIVSMLRRSRRFPTLFLCQWLAIPVGLIMDVALISTVGGLSVSRLLAVDVLLEPMVWFVISGIWTAYVYRSVRVRNTFGGDTAATQAATFS